MDIKFLQELILTGLLVYGCIMLYMDIKRFNNTPLIRL
jgi:hypothetical protein